MGLLVLVYRGRGLSIYRFLESLLGFANFSQGKGNVTYRIGNEETVRKEFLENGKLSDVVDEE